MGDHETYLLHRGVLKLSFISICKVQRFLGRGCYKVLLSYTSLKNSHFLKERVRGNKNHSFRKNPSSLNSLALLSHDRILVSPSAVNGSSILQQENQIACPHFSLQRGLLNEQCEISLVLRDLNWEKTCDFKGLPIQRHSGKLIQIKPSIPV